MKARKGGVKKVAKAGKGVTLVRPSRVTKPLKTQKLTLRPFKLPAQFETRTSSGLSVIVAPRGTIPLAAIRLTIPGGSSVEDPKKAGLADFTTRLLRRGAGGLDADAINEAVEFVGGSLDMGASEDQVDLVITTPSDHVPAMLTVLGKLVSAPAFEEREVSSARERTAARLANDLDDPGSVAERAFMRALWGSHPYGHSATPATVNSFTREDVVKFHRDWLGPKVSLLVVVGNVDPDAVHAAAEQAFGGWSGGPESITVPTPREHAEQSGKILLVDKPDQTQSQVRIGAMTLQKTHPDYHAVIVANCILGAGFTSRLVDEIRVNRGLSYGVSSYVSPMRGGSTFGVDTFTKTSTTREIIDVALAQVEKLRAKGISEKELAKAKTYLCGLYPLRLETNESIAGGISDIRLSRLAPDWVERYRDLVQAVTREAAGAAAKKHLLRDPPVIVVVGKADEVAPQLKGLQPLQQLKVADLG